MLAGQADVSIDASHAIPRADATEPAGDVPAAVRPSVLPANHRRTRADAGEDGAVDGSAAYADASGARARHDSDRRRTRLDPYRLPLAQGIHLALPARRRAGTRDPDWPWRIAHHADATPRNPDQPRRCRYRRAGGAEPGRPSAGRLPVVRKTRLRRSFRYHRRRGN